METTKQLQVFLRDYKYEGPTPFILRNPIPIKFDRALFVIQWTRKAELTERHLRKLIKLGR